MIARCVALAMIAMLAAPAIAEAQLGVNCTIGTTPVAFGDYNVLSATPKTTTGSVTYQCTLGVNIIVTLSRGSSAAFDPRTMRNGAEVLNYNLYRETTFQTIWGDGTGGTQTYTAFAAAAGPGDRDGVWAGCRRGRTWRREATATRWLQRSSSDRRLMRETTIPIPSYHTPGV